MLSLGSPAVSQLHLYAEIWQHVEAQPGALPIGNTDQGRRGAAGGVSLSYFPSFLKEALSY